MAANLTKCKICGEAYNYCPNCANTHGWRFYADTHEHYQIHLILDGYKTGLYTKAQACEMFEGLGITADSDLSKFLPEISDFIKKIVTVEAEPKEIEKKTVLTKTKKSKLYKDD